MERRTSWIRTGLEWVAIAVFMALVLNRTLPKQASEPSVLNARTFTLTGLDGSPIPPSLYKGKAVLLNFWAPWCPPCRLEIPWLQRLQDKNGSKLLVVGVVADQDEYARAAAMMQKKGVTYLLAQNSPSLQRAFGNPSGLPTSFYISPSSHIVHTVTGLVPEYVMSHYATDAINQR